MTSRNGNAYKRRLRQDLHRVSPALPAPFMIHCTCTCRLQAPKLKVIHTPCSPGIFTCRVLHTSRRSRESRGLKHVILLAARKRWPTYEDIGRAFTPTMAARLQNRAGSRCAIGDYMQIGKSTNGSHSLNLKQSDCHRRGLSHSPSCIQNSLSH